MLIRSVAWFSLVVVGILMLFQLLILLPAVQNKLKIMVVSALEDNLEVEASIGYFKLDFPKKIRVGEILMVAKDGDTLVSLGEFSVNVAILPLLKKKIVVQQLYLENVRGDIGKVIALLSSQDNNPNPGPEPEPDPPADSADEDEPWTFGIRQLDLVSLDLEYRDEDVGIDLGMQLGQVRITLGDVNLDSLIHVKSVSIARSNVSLEMLETPPSVEEADTGDFSFADITVGELFLSEVGFNLIDSVSGMMLYTHAGSLSSGDNFVDIIHTTIGVDEVSMDDSWCDIVFLPSMDAAAKTDTVQSDEALDWGQYLWRITGNRLELENCRYTMEYTDEPEIKGHFDPFHMHILEASGEISDFILDADTLIAKITNLRAKEENGFEISRFDVEIAQEDSSLTIRDMNIETPRTTLSVELETTANPTNYSGLEKEVFDLDIAIKGMNWLDVDYFYPFLKEQEFLTEAFGSGNFEMAAGISGSLPDLDVRQFIFRSLDSMIVSVNGKIVEGADPDAMEVSLKIEELMTCRSEVEANFNLGIPDSSFRLPTWLVVSGNYSGTSADHHFTGNIRSSNGEIVISEATVGLGDNPHYHLSMMADLQQLTSLADLGLDQASFELESDIRGDDPSTMMGNLEVAIDSLTYRSFLYTGLDLKSEIDNGNFVTAFESAMPVCQVSLKADGTIRPDDFWVDLSANVDNLDLHSLNLNKEEFTIKGKTDIFFGMHQENAYDLVLNLHELELNYEDSLYRMHPVDLSLATDENHTDFSLKSYYYQLLFNAGAHIEELADAFVHLPGYYLSEKSVDSVQFSLPEFQVSGSLEYPEAFANLFFPDVPEFEEFTITGGYSKSIDQLRIDLFLPTLNAGGLLTDSLYFTVKGSSEELDFVTAAVLTVPDLMTGKMKVKGAFKDSELTTNLVYKDSFDKEYLNLTARIDTVKESIMVYFVPPDLVFSYDKWKVNPDSRVTLNPDFIAFENFELVNEGEKISIVSFPAEEPENLELKLTDFGLGSLEQLLAMDTVVTGTANADVRILDPLGKLAVEGSLEIDNLLLYDFDAGRLEVSEFAITSDTTSVSLSLTGAKQDILIEGFWDARDSLNPINAKLKINSLNLAELNYLMEDYISDAKGQLEGDIQVAGNTSNPIFNGFLSFSGAGMGIDQLNNYFSFGTESITVEKNVFRFDDFSIRNKRNQAATISGTINLGDMSNAYTNLLVKTDNMEIMNSTRKQNDILFGLLKAQADFEVKGDVKDIRLNADVTIDKSTSITYIFPDNLALNNNDGVVRYDRFEPELIADEDISKSTSFFSMESFRNIRSKIEVQSGARFNLFFDSGGNNFLDAALSGNISYRQVQDNTEVSGQIEVEEGILHYGIPMVAVDEYEIEPGSIISLSNDLYNPYLNIVASSSVRASTEGLMASDPKVMTFKVLLYMAGELNDVKLRFDISQETGDALVSSRLSQLTDQERNMNALNLLVRGSFMMSLHGDELGGTTTVDAQIDKFYTTHLNHLISENVSFVDLKFDVQSFKEYNTSGETVMQRNYYYNVGKSLFKDRARINYKGSLGVTSDMQSEQINSSFVQNELEMEVKITKDGVLRGVFFRRNQYEGLLEGEVIETGGGIRLRKDFYSIGDIFTNESRQQEKRGENPKIQNPEDK